MNKILSKIVAASLLSTVAITAVNAAVEPNDTITKNPPVWGTSQVQEGGELLGADVDLNVTLGSNSASDTHFTLNFVNGSIADTGAYALCNNGRQAGTYLAPEKTNANGRITAVVMEFKPEDGNTSLISKGEVLNFVSGDDCSKVTTANIIPDTGKCVTVFSNHGENTSGSVAIPGINSKPSNKIIEYKHEIKISCTVPVCGVSDDAKSFIPQGTIAAINSRAAVPQSFDRNTSLEYGCLEDGCGTVTASTAPTCTTLISIENNTDFNITKFALTPKFDGTLPSGLKFTYDYNATTHSTLTDGKATSISSSIAPDENKTISLTFTTDGKTTIPTGLLSGVFSKFDSNATGSKKTALMGAKVSPKDGLAKFAKSLGTEFTVTYMSPLFKSFAMITATSGKTTLKARVTDSTGKSVTVPLRDIEKGDSTYVFVDRKTNHDNPTNHLQDLDALVAATGVKLNISWRVDFIVSNAVDVAAYMDVNGGQRTLTVLYPQ